MRLSEADSSRKYRLVEVIGRSTTGDVYLADHTPPDGRSEPVVIRVLNGDAARLGAIWKRMHDEARLLARLAHPSIVAARDHVEFGSRRAIVTDLVPGADLDHVLAALELAGERFPARAAFEVVAAVADALDAASTGVVDGAPIGQLHRDLRPSNVRITTSGGVRVLDFGVARGSDEPEATSAGLVGAEETMAPERLIGTMDLPAGDVYSAAATLVELLLGRPLGRTPIVPDLHARFVEEVLRQVGGQIAGPKATVTQALDTIRVALDVRHAVRPSARELASTLQALALELDGESLVAFAARFLPSIDAVLGRMRTPVTGVLAERVMQPPDDGTLSRTPALLAVRAPVHPLRPTEVVAWLVAAAALSTLFGAGSMFLLARVHPWVTPPSPAPALVEVAAVARPVVPAPLPVRVVPASVQPNVRPMQEPVRRAPSVRPMGPRIDRAMFVVRDASAVQVTCGDVTSEGTATVRITAFPAGTCTVVATGADGRTVRGDVVVDGALRVVCATESGALRCSPSR